MVGKNKRRGIKLIDYSIYLVTDSSGLTEKDFFRIIEQACKSGVTLLQLREKELSTRDFYQRALKVKQITDHYKIPLIINDRLDICLAVDAAGLHIGDDEMPVEICRQLIGDKILGVSVKSLEAATEAEDAGADYFGVGAIFPTETKDTSLVAINTLKEITGCIQLPVVAIGGIKENNLEELSGSKINGVAIVSEIMQSPNIEAKVLALKNKFKDNKEQVNGK
ncbi:thiamine phosphate synthase [Enterococcus sp. AZ103]|uniref:thiamine phosphate synthase n=1 Tax=Enterococcus sp. AZ103 TaxID=2774628 RepID=UPI003F6830E6